MKRVEAREERRSEQFLKQFRVLEGLLEKRYAGRRISSGSVVMEYLHDADSMPCRSDLDMCREIRNLLSHNTDDDGEAVVEPSEGVVQLLKDIVDYVQRPRLARNYGTPGDRVMYAHPNDCALDVMRHMQRMGYSHVPVRDRNGLVGVFSAQSLMRYACELGFDALKNELRIGDLKSELEFNDERREKYLFFSKDATLTEVRAAFEPNREHRTRPDVAFITEDGTRQSNVLSILSPSDLLKDAE